MKMLDFRRTCMLVLCSLVIGGQAVWGQQAVISAQIPPPAVSRQMPIAVSVAPYDVVSIRISHLASNNQHITTSNGSLLAETAKLRLLIRFAYDVPDQLLVGGPAWINDTKFDIRGKTDAVQSIDRTMLGLKLEPQKGPVAVTVIDRAELPSES